MKPWEELVWVWQWPGSQFVKGSSQLVCIEGIDGRIVAYLLSSVWREEEGGEGGGGAGGGSGVVGGGQGWSGNFGAGGGGPGWANGDMLIWDRSILVPRRGGGGGGGGSGGV